MRFRFGKNWRSFLSVLDENRIAEAQRAISDSLGRGDLRGWRVLDIGSGSGLSSLAMHRMGAEIVSFDYDIDSVACTEEVRHRFAGNSQNWEIRQGSVLDANFMQGLGKFDLVYAWGVLHHTGAMWPALELARERVLPGGRLVVALYNDQGWQSRFWWHVKRIYCSGRAGQSLISAIFFPLFALYAIVHDIKHLRIPGTYMREYISHRGMSITHDWHDWLGGFPFEVATPKQVIDVLSESGFVISSQTLTKGWGCSEFVLKRSDVRHGH